MDADQSAQLNASGPNADTEDREELIIRLLKDYVKAHGALFDLLKEHPGDIFQTWHRALTDLRGS